MSTSLCDFTVTLSCQFHSRPQQLGQASTPTTITMCLNLPATLALRADALAVFAVSAVVGCPQTILTQAALGSQQGHMRSAAVLGVMQQYAASTQAVMPKCSFRLQSCKQMFEWRLLCRQHCSLGRFTYTFPSTKGEMCQQ